MSNKATNPYAIVTYASYGWAVEGTEDTSCVLIYHRYAYRGLGEHHKAIGVRLQVSYVGN